MPVYPEWFDGGGNTDDYGATAYFNNVVHESDSQGGDADWAGGGAISLRTDVYARNDGDETSICYNERAVDSSDISHDNASGGFHCADNGDANRELEAISNNQIVLMITILFKRDIHLLDKDPSALFNSEGCSINEKVSQLYPEALIFLNIENSVCHKAIHFPNYFFIIL